MPDTSPAGLPRPLSAQELQRLLHDTPRPRIVDVREQQELVIGKAVMPQWKVHGRLR